MKKMSKKATILIELNYDLEDMRFMVGEEFPEEQFEMRVEEYAYHDLQDLMRSGDITDWARVSYE
jgi:hypothetical protein